MEICTCQKCRYTFLYPRLPENCPDCGAASVRKATAKEVREYRRMRIIIHEELLLEMAGCVSL